MIDSTSTGSPPPERGGSTREARRVGVTRFNRTSGKTSFARRLRRNATDVEVLLWQKLRRGQMNGFEFRRQHPAGPYVLDFYCPAVGLAVELDGGQHNDSRGVERDRQRTAWLSERGIVVLRFWNFDVTTNLRGVLETIGAAAENLSTQNMTPTRRWRADLPLAGGGSKPKGCA